MIEVVLIIKPWWGGIGWVCRPAPEPLQAGVVWPDRHHWSPWRYSDAEVDQILRRETYDRP